MEKIGILRNIFKPFWNSQTIDTGKIPVFHTVKYAKTSETKIKEAKKGIKSSNMKLSRMRTKEIKNQQQRADSNISISTGSKTYKNGETTIQKTSSTGIPSVLKSITCINMQKISCDAVQRTAIANVRTKNARKLPSGCNFILIFFII